MALIPPAPLGSPLTSYTWADWYEKVRREINAGATVDLTAVNVVGILPIAKGGTGTISPSLLAGTNIAITGTFPAQTVSFTGILAKANGGTGTATPALVAGTGITLSGTWPAQTVGVTANTYVLRAGDTMTGTLTITSPDAATTINATAPSAGQTAYIIWQHSGTPRGYIGIAGAAGGLIAGSVLGDTTIRAETRKIMFSTDAGATAAGVFDTSGNLTVAGGLTTGSTTLHTTTAALTNGAGASVGTLNNAPAAGNPTKWISINDNGTVRKIPCW